MSSDWKAVPLAMPADPLSTLDLVSSLAGGYAGKLANGPARPLRGLLSMFNPVDQAEDAALLKREREDRLPLLFDHFQIDSREEGAWEALARALAVRHVPGFDWAPWAGLGDFSGNPWPGGSPHLGLGPVPKRRGRPRKTPPQGGGGLLDLLGATPKEPSRKGAPKKYTAAERAELIAIIDAVRARHSLQSYMAAAQLLAERWHPDRNRVEREKQARRICGLYKRFKHEAGKRAQATPDDPG